VEYFTGAINHSRGVLHGAIENHSCVCPTGFILHGENVAFQSNGNDFHKVSLTLDEFEGIWGHYFAIGSD
jgi:hypothetical protein